MNYEALGYNRPPSTDRLSCRRPGTNSDYCKFLYGAKPVTKTDSVNDPSLLDFCLIPLPGFVKLHRGDYVVFDTDTYPLFYTGFITSEPEFEYVGVDATHSPVWGFNYQVTSDEYLLNLKPIGIMAPIMNKTQGQIIKILVNKLAPGKYDVSGV